jgi:hypothetical protein
MHVTKLLKCACTFLCLLPLVPAKGQSWLTSGANLYSPASSRIGIGTSSPTEKLTVQDGNLALTRSTSYDIGGANWRYITAASQYSVFNIGTNPNIATGEANGPMIQMGARSNGWIPGRMIYYAYADPAGLSAGAAHDFNNYNSARGGFISLMTLIDDNGKAKVTIGDVGGPAAPSGYGLIVERGILTERVRVAVKGSAEWADHVFAPGYQLMSLHEVKHFINEQQHLPGIPGVQEVIAEGVDLGQMQAQLLQKVEELTLYLIEQQAQIASLNKQLQQLKKRQRH